MVNYNFKAHQRNFWRQVFSIKGDENISSSNIPKIIDCYINCLDDYTVDRRGDIGAWVREAAMSGILQLLQTIAASDVGQIEDVWVRQIMPRLAQQAVEKIDRTR